MLEARWKIVGIKHTETSWILLCVSFYHSVVVLFEAFRPSLKIARSIENKPNLGTVTMLLSIGNNSSQSKSGNASLKSFSKCKT